MQKFQDESLPMPLESDFGSLELTQSQRNRLERRRDMQALKQLKIQIQELSAQIHILEKSRQESAEMFESLRSILQVLSMFEKFCIFVVKVSAAVAAMYASWKYVLVKIAEQVRNG